MMHKRWKRIVSRLLCFALLLSLMPGMSLPAMAVSDVPYLDESGTTQNYSGDYTEIIDSTPTTWEGGWYVVADSDVSISGVTLAGNVNLILCDGAKLTIENASGDGIDGGESYSLTIYGQSGGTGVLEVTGTGNNSCGIEADDVTINGGSVTASASASGSSSYGIYAYSYVTINGGSVTASGSGDYSTGICADDLTINGGTVNASASGGGSCGISVYSDVTINGGDVTASGGWYAIYASNSVTVASGLTVMAGANEEDAADVTSTFEANHDDYKYAHIYAAPVPYMAWDGTKLVEKTGDNACQNYTLVTGSISDVVCNTGWYVVSGDATITDGVTLNGDVNLILKDGARLTIENSEGFGISGGSGSRLTIYGQSGGTGALIVTGGSGSCGILADNVTIHGGTVTAKDHALWSSAATRNDAVYVADGKITAVSSVLRLGSPSPKAGIRATDVTIHGGVVTATGTEGNSYGIYADTVTIDSGVVTATGNSSGSYGISASTVTIHGGVVSAIGEAQAIDGSVANDIAGTGWTNMAGTGDGAAIATSTDGRSLTYQKVLLPVVTYRDATVDGTTHAVSFSDATCKNYTPVTPGLTEWNDGYYVAGSNVTISGRVYLDGDVYLILCDGVTLTASGMICGDSSLTVYGQSGGTGKLIAGRSGELGIGSSGGNITINGGVVDATGGYSSGIETSGGVVTINGGTVNAVGRQGGIRSYNTVSIHGGTVTATGTGGGLEAGSAARRNTAVYVADGRVTAMSSVLRLVAYSSGISAGNVSITGGDVTASGTDYAIRAGVVTIGSGMTVMAGDSAENNANVTSTFEASHTQKWAHIYPGTPTPPTPPSYDSGDSTPAATTITVPVSSESASVNVTATIRGTTAAVKAPTAEELDRVVSTTNHTGEVEIDVSALGTEIKTADIPTETIQAVEKAVNDASNDATGLTVKLSDGSVTFDAQALTAVAEQAKGSTVQLNLDGVSTSSMNTAQRATAQTMDVQAVYDAYMSSNGQRISDFHGGRATVSVPYTLKAGQRGNGIVVWYIADNGSKTEMPTSYNGREVSFTTTHFSNYVVAYDEERAAVCPQDATCPISAFTDADASAWYHDGVHWALENGVMDGVGNRRFNPNGDTSRAMVAVMLWRLEGSPVVNYAMNYADVAENAWYADAVRWAASTKIASGYRDANGGGQVFNPDAAVTREQFATMLYNYAKYKGVDVSAGESANIQGYGDVSSVSGYALPAVKWAYGAGIMTGYVEKGQHILGPQRASSRAVVATMLMRYSTAK